MKHDWLVIPGGEGKDGVLRSGYWRCSICDLNISRPYGIGGIPPGGDFECHGRGEGHIPSSSQNTYTPRLVEVETALIVQFFYLIIAHLIYAAWWVYVVVESLGHRIYCVFSWIKKGNRWWR